MTMDLGFPHKQNTAAIYINMKLGGVLRIALVCEVVNLNNIEHPPVSYQSGAHGVVDTRSVILPSFFSSVQGIFHRCRPCSRVSRVSHCMQTGVCPGLLAVSCCLITIPLLFSVMFHQTNFTPVQRSAVPQRHKCVLPALNVDVLVCFCISSFLSLFHYIQHFAL